MTNGNEPINPTTERNWLNQNDTEMVTGVFGGLTKREYFAAMMLQGLVTLSSHQATHQQYASQAIAYADALITELNLTP